MAGARRCSWTASRFRLWWRRTPSALPALAAPVDVSDGWLRLDDLRFYDRPLVVAGCAAGDALPRRVLLITPGKRSNDQAARLGEYYLTCAVVWRQAYTDGRPCARRATS